jgi:RNA polymerase sigma factor FliA
MNRPASTRATPCAASPRRDSDLRQLLDFVRRIARRMCRRLPPSVQVDDLVSAGNEGLVQALRAFDASRGIRFTTFARHRITGAMLDHLQRLDVMSRSLRQRQRTMESTARQLTARLGREPTEAELAGASGVPIARYRHYVQQTHRARFVSLSHPHDGEHACMPEPSDPGPDPEALLAESDMRARIWAAVDTLPSRQCAVVRMYYEREMTLTQVGQALGVTESRACQLKSQATKRLRGALLQ